MKTACILLLMAVAAAGDPGGRGEPVSALESRISVEFRNVPLSAALAEIGVRAGVKIVYSEPADPNVRLILRDLKVRSILALLLGAHGLNVIWKDGVLVVCGCQRGADPVSVRIYDVRSRELKIRDFPGFHIQQPKLLIASWSEDLCALSYSYTLVELVRENTGDRSWDSNPKVAINLVQGLLIVSQTSRVHREIEELLARLPM